MPSPEDIASALVSFFTSTVTVVCCPQGLALRSIYWEPRDGWLYPWRVVGYRDGVAQCYPCGDPKRAEYDTVRR